MNGRLASIAGPAETTPGSSARASVRNGGNAAFKALNAGIAAASVRGSSATAFSSATFWRANAFAVVLKSVIRLCRVRGCALSACATVAWAAIQPERSCGAIPSALWATIELFLYAGSQYGIDALNPGPPCSSASRPAARGSADCGACRN